MKHAISVSKAASFFDARTGTDHFMLHLKTFLMFVAANFVKPDSAS